MSGSDDRQPVADVEPPIAGRADRPAPIRRRRCPRCPTPRRDRRDIAAPCAQSPRPRRSDDGAGRRRLDARTRAHARYSGFKVGAALETADGDVITGCNIENATYGLTVCAERVALFKALSEGHRVFTRIAVVADTEAPTPPCGACRQLLWEYCGDIEVMLANLDGRRRRRHAADGAAAAAVRRAAARVTDGLGCSTE